MACRRACAVYGIVVKWRRAKRKRGRRIRVSTIREEELSVELVDRLLFRGIEDTGERADCIIVLGSEKAVKYRVPAAVEAFKAGRAGKIMLCGGAAGEIPEAELMRRAALEMGVGEEDIIMESSSQNTVENILFALVELQRAFWLNKVRRVLLVTTAFHMRRALAIARYLFPEHIELVPCPANDSNTRRDNWMDTPAGIERARGEAMNIVRCVQNGLFPDFEI